MEFPGVVGCQKRQGKCGFNLKVTTFALLASTACFVLELLLLLLLVLVLRGFPRPF